MSATTREIPYNNKRKVFKTRENCTAIRQNSALNGQNKDPYRLKAK